MRQEGVPRVLHSHSSNIGSWLMAMHLYGQRPVAKSMAARSDTSGRVWS